MWTNANKIAETYKKMPWGGWGDRYGEKTSWLHPRSTVTMTILSICTNTVTRPLWLGPVKDYLMDPSSSPWTRASIVLRGAICCNQGHAPPLPSARLMSSSSRGAGCDSRGVFFPSLLGKRTYEPRDRWVKLVVRATWQELSVHMHIYFLVLYPKDTMWMEEKISQWRVPVRKQP